MTDEHKRLRDAVAPVLAFLEHWQHYRQLSGDYDGTVAFNIDGKRMRLNAQDVATLRRAFDARLMQQAATAPHFWLGADA